MTAQSKIAQIRDRSTRFKARQRLDEHEFNVYLAYAPEGFDGASTNEPLPALVRIDPPPRVVSKPLDTVAEGRGGGLETVRLQRYELSDISRRYSDSDLRPLYWIVISADQEVTPEQAQAREVPRYRLSGNPNLLEAHWQVMLVEDR